MSETMQGSSGPEFDRQTAIEQATKIARVHPVMALSAIYSSTANLDPTIALQERTELCFAVGSNVLRDESTLVSHKTGKPRFGMTFMTLLLDQLSPTDKWADRVDELAAELDVTRALAERAGATREVARRLRAAAAVERDIQDNP